MRGTLYALALAVGLPLAALGWHAYDAENGLRGFALGAAFGFAVVGVNRICVRRQERADTQKLFQEVMLGFVVSLFLFLIGTLVIGVAWKAGAVPAALTALPLYLVTHGFEVWGVMSTLREWRGHPGEGNGTAVDGENADTRPEENTRSE